MKKTVIVLLAVALVLILVTGALLWYFLSLLPRQKAPASNADVERYLAENWTIFRVAGWDAERAELKLEYDLPFTYSQVVKYADAVEELRQTPEGNLRTLEDLCDTVREELGVEIRSVTVRGVTADGETAYTVCNDGSIVTCWDDPASP